MVHWGWLCSTSPLPQMDIPTSHCREVPLHLGVSNMNEFPQDVRERIRARMADKAMQGNQARYVSLFLHGEWIFNPHAARKCTAATSVYIRVNPVSSHTLSPHSHNVEEEGTEKKPCK